ncbi:methylated-DNA--[protein]-cysteine S-methyltransferase [Subtercola boreus]|uniref:Cysteine methyltransferase n=1 Tax=Subtercola boreus TaxID=120213 RepID=A0A3E0W9F4_9MICO|nr:methylated-DNA--[protein]-cysteine S-methyltransferase [Subtercola boreus]RFA20269.1 cysteine methyltransferase [Subtercola boreus]RFA20421.1 cysteine methyltransferase [Subtercola boreus]RFA26673.1 cysteine methyltransferase [Subtercola boreus]
MTAPLFLARTESPLGRLELTATDTAVTSLSIERALRLPHDDEPERPNPVLDDAVRQLTEYFAGTRTRFTVPVQLVGTTFQQEIWNALSSVGWGEALSYAELGLAAGRPGSGRAVGGAVGANPVPILIGCHRVLASNRRLTGYSAGNGLPTKIWLLDHELIEHR